MIYRPEIDGLRALAVVAVVLFHIGGNFVRGGYVGVDVFFVISGYLITSILLRDLDQNRFSLAHFYERRARRILPALFFILICCLPFALLLMIPSELTEFSISLTAVLAFVSNFFFWRRSGYFAPSAEEQPLLHTWSLAIEEQFYFIFPLFLLFSWRFLSRRITIIILIGTVIVSLLLVEWALWEKTITPAAIFYLTPTRAWELIIGALCAYILFDKSITASNFLSLSGLCLILVAMFHFDETTPFPSLYTLIPVIGTALILVYGTTTTLTGKLLSLPPLVGIGLISYSLYLWHQPLFAFARLKPGDPPLIVEMLLLALAAVVLSYFTWKHIEQPFRKREHVSVAAMLVFFATALVVLFSFTTWMSLTNGREQQWLRQQTEATQKVYAIINNLSEEEQSVKEVPQDNGDCRFRALDLTPAVEERLKVCTNKYGSGILVIGDSHAGDLFQVITSRRTDDFIVSISQGECRIDKALPICNYERFMKFIPEHPQMFSLIIFERAGFRYLNINNEPIINVLNHLPIDSPVPPATIDKEYVNVAISFLEELSNSTKVMWFGPRIEMHFRSRTILSSTCENPPKPRPGQEQMYRDLDTYISNQVAQSSKILYASQIEAYQLSFPRDFIDCNYLYYHGGSHFSKSGHREFGSRFDLIEYAQEKAKTTSNFR